eukprot:UN02494
MSSSSDAQLAEFIFFLLVLIIYGIFLCCRAMFRGIKKVICPDNTTTTQIKPINISRPNETTTTNQSGSGGTTTTTQQYSTASLDQVKNPALQAADDPYRYTTTPNYVPPPPYGMPNHYAPYHPYPQQQQFQTYNQQYETYNPYYLPTLPPPRSAVQPPAPQQQHMTYASSTQQPPTTEWATAPLLDDPLEKKAAVIQ